MRNRGASSAVTLSEAKGLKLEAESYKQGRKLNG